MKATIKTGRLPGMHIAGKTGLFALIAALLCASILPASAAQPGGAACDYPTTAWAAPESSTRDALQAALDQSAALPYLRSLLVVRDRCLIAEAYFGGAAANASVNSYSITKSVTAALIGMAIADDLIPSVYTPIGALLDIDANAPQASITLDDLLKMLSGIGWDENSAADIGGMLALNRHEVDYILSLPMAHIPGTYWNYSTADSHLLSAVLSSATGESALDYARTHLFAPLGIEAPSWTADIDGVNLGGTQLFWTPQDMARFGLLILEGGLWNGEQVIPSGWIDYMLHPQLRDPSAYALSYAAHWWHVYAENQPPMSAAVGYGGQFILLAPYLNAVIVTTADSTLGAPDRYISGALAERRVSEVLDLLLMDVLPVLEAESL